MTGEEKRKAELASRMGKAIFLLFVRGVLTEAEKRKAERRLVKWADREGVRIVRANAVTGEKA